MRGYVQQQLKSYRRRGISSSRGRRASSTAIAAAHSVSLPSDMNVVVDEHICNHFGNPWITSLPQERHLVNLTAEPYHIRRIPHSVHNKLNHRRRSDQRRK